MGLVGGVLGILGCSYMDGVGLVDGVFVGFGVSLEGAISL